ncbi:HNH endonuclease [Aquirufa nivalisilvae]|uniref:homing endonuclease associated repeat-containing protein n=1 Tax=Aquirufa nivalisilvae TaxID=2516557 RepID=UPI0022A8F8CC|nr:HNH endonuclease [Aquirufa nivalisilvae]MCZ2483313.1 HNH endonuclease [Aquirufa nivalisilvae]
MMDKFEPNKLLNYDDSSIIAELKRVYFNHFDGLQMTNKEFDKLSRVSAGTVIKRFTSWNNALKAAGISIFNEISKPIIKTDIEKAIRLNNGQYITFVFYKNNGGKFSESSIKRYFENRKWAEILASEFSLYPIRKIIIVDKPVEVKTEDQLFDEIKRVWNELERRPTYSEFRIKAKFGTKIYEKRYGSWTKAIETFCASNANYLSSSKGIGFNTTKEMLIQELKKIVQDNNLEILHQADYERYGGKYTIQTFYNHFGSWKNAKVAAGLKIGRALPEKHELFDELQRIWEQLGRQPISSEMKKLGKFSYKSYSLKFGGWTKAIYSFIEYMQDDTQDGIQEDIAETITVEPLIVEELQKSSILNNENATIIKMKTPRTVSTRLRFKVFMRDNFVCQYCGRTVQDGAKLEADHIVAYSKGGETILENLRTACWTCNNGKSNETL